MRRKYFIRFAFLTLVTIAYVSTRQALANEEPLTTLNARIAASTAELASATTNLAAGAALIAPGVREHERWVR